MRGLEVGVEPGPVVSGIGVRVRVLPMASLLVDSGGFGDGRAGQSGSAGPRRPREREVTQGGPPDGQAQGEGRGASAPEVRRRTAGPFPTSLRVSALRRYTSGCGRDWLEGQASESCGTRPR